jgi:peptide methionine sulfoxide reductase MsrA
MLALKRSTRHARCEIFHSGKVVTEVSLVGTFWEAKPEHQDYLEKIPNGYTCHFVRPDWKLPVRRHAGGVGSSIAE